MGFNKALSVKQTSNSNVFGRLVRVVPIAMLVGTIVNIILYVVAGALIPELSDWPGAGIGQIVGATVVYLLIGALVFAAVARLSSRPGRHYLIAATLGLLLSLSLPVAAGLGYDPSGAPAAGAAIAVTLSLMHVITYAISVPLFIRYGLPNVR